MVQNLKAPRTIGTGKPGAAAGTADAAKFMTAQIAQ
jgi:hypothetical protein